MSERGFVRPILRTETSQCCWVPTDPPFQVGEVHLFQISCRHPPEIPHPHRADDVLLEYRQILSGNPNMPDLLYDHLVSHSHQSVMDVFGDTNIVQKEYIVEVIEGTDCPSVGICRCKGKNLQFYANEYGKKRCKINQQEALSFDFPITCCSLQTYGILPPADDNVLVILGLGRPFDGNGKFDPKRCYILIIGIISEHEQRLEKSFSSKCHLQ